VYTKTAGMSARPSLAPPQCLHALRRQRCGWGSWGHCRYSREHTGTRSQSACRSATSSIDAFSSCAVACTHGNRVDLAPRPRSGRLL